MKRCPGSLSFSQPKPEIITCAECEAETEIWSDDASGTCPKCGNMVIRNLTVSCVDWCKFAKECLGNEKYRMYGEMQAAMRKPALIKAMSDYFGKDKKRIDHAKTVVAYSEIILPRETSADPNVVLAAAVLHDIGIKNAEEKHGSSASEHQELEGPPVAREMLVEFGYPGPFIDEVCDIIGHHHRPQPDDSINFKVLYDADMLTNTERQRMRARGRTTLPAEILDAFLTDAGREIAIEAAKTTD